MKKLFYQVIKKALLALLFLIPFAGNSLAQNKRIVFPGNKTEKEAKNKTYFLYKQGSYDLIYNKNNSLMIYESDFERKTLIRGYGGLMELKGRNIIDSLGLKSFSPFFKDYNLNDGYLEVEINLYSKPNGEICELMFTIPGIANIPIKTIEQLENKILSLGLTIKLTEEGYFLEDALWIRYPVRFSVENMKKHLKDK